MRNFNTLLLTAAVLAMPVLSLAQNVGIGTSTPNASAMLDVYAGNRGILIPRVALTATNAAGPVASPATSLMVYNTATAGAAPNNVTPGYYYWDGTSWNRLNNGVSWDILGNANTTSGTNFLGTTNAQALDFRTNNTIRFRVANGAQVFAMSDGTPALPFYSWDSDANTGMYRIGADNLGFSTNGVERFRMTSTSAVFNENAADYDFRVESTTSANAIFLDASTNNIGLNTGTPGNQVHFQGDGRNIWLTLWNNNYTNGSPMQVSNNAATNGNRVLMGVTNYNASITQASAVIGLSLNTTGSGGTGVQGSANNGAGIAVYGNLGAAGTGWAGYFDYDVYCGGTYYGSDRRLKRDIHPIDKALGIIKKIEPVSYFYNTEQYPNIGLDENRQSYGFIAQDLETVLPELVKEKNLITNSTLPKTADMQQAQETGLFKVVNYTLMIPILTQAVKEQQAIIETQNKRIENLERIISEMQKK